MIYSVPLLPRGPLKGHTAGIGCAEIVVEFNSCSITGEDSNVNSLSYEVSGPYMNEFVMLSC